MKRWMGWGGALCLAAAVALFAGPMGRSLGLLADVSALSLSAPSRQGKLPCALGGSLYLIDLNRRTATWVARPGLFTQDAAINSDGTLIAYANRPKEEAPAHITVCHADGTGARHLTSQTDGWDSLPAISPDGRRVALCRTTNLDGSRPGKAACDIYTVGVDGTGLKRITLAGYPRLDGLRYSPDGRTLLFAAGSARMDIFTISADGGGSPKPLTNRASNSMPSYSPDGKRIVFLSDQGRAGDLQVWVMNADGTSARKVSHNGRRCQYPVFTPDGRSVLFLYSPEDNGFCSLMSTVVDTGKTHQYLPNGFFANPLKWKP